MKLGGLITAMVTPFDGQLRVDYDRAAELAVRLAEEGSQGIVVAGTTGESPTLTSEEKLKLMKTVADAVGSRMTVIGGTGSNNTESSIELTRKAESTGIHGVMLVVPYYNKPPQEGLYNHFKAIADSTGLPVMLYNVPGRTGANLSPETVLRLAEHPRIVAIKEASGNLDQVSQIIRGSPEDFCVLSGDDSLTLPILAVGGTGIVSVASHVVGRAMRRMIDSYNAGEVKEAARLHLELMPVFKSLFVTANPIPVKYALKLAGFDAGGYRSPLLPPSAKEAEVIEASLKAVGVIR